jgi:hypothetical protein
VIQHDLVVRYQNAAQAIRDMKNPGPDLLRKAEVYDANVKKLTKWAIDHDLIKGFPIRRRLKWQGLDVSIENPAGSIRKWFDHSENRHGQTHMLYDYGYIRRTKGVDGDAVDVYMGPHPDEANTVYVVRQMRAPRFDVYDEDKCMVGFLSRDDAEMAYRMHYDNPNFCGQIDAYPVDMFCDAVRKTARAPEPVGGWASLYVPLAMDAVAPSLAAALVMAHDEYPTSAPSFNQFSSEAMLDEAQKVEQDALRPKLQMYSPVYTDRPPLFGEDIAKLGLDVGGALYKGLIKGEGGFTPPAAVQSAARRGLALRKQHGKGGLTTQEAGKQGIGSGVQRASDLSSGEALSLATVKRMHAFFSRFKGNRGKEGWGSSTNPSKAWIAWLLWGGDAGQKWSAKIAGNAQNESK